MGCVLLRKRPERPQKSCGVMPRRGGRWPWKGCQGQTTPSLAPSGQGKLLLRCLCRLPSLPMVSMGEMRETSSFATDDSTTSRFRDRGTRSEKQCGLGTRGREVFLAVPAVRVSARKSFGSSTRALEPREVAVPPQFRPQKAPLSKQINLPQIEVDFNSPDSTAIDMVSITGIEMDFPHTTF